MTIRARTIEATFVLREGNDPTYDKIYGGKWLCDCPYATIHRIASSGKVHGLDKALNGNRYNVQNVKLPDGEIIMPDIDTAPHLL